MYPTLKECFIPIIVLHSKVNFVDSCSKLFNKSQITNIVNNTSLPVFSQTNKICHWLQNTHEINCAFQWKYGTYLHKITDFQFKAAINVWLIYFRFRRVTDLSGATGCFYDNQTFRCTRWRVGLPAWTGRVRLWFPRNDLHVANIIWLSKMFRVFQLYRRWISLYMYMCIGLLIELWYIMMS